MDVNNNQAEKFSMVMQDLIVVMKEIDDTCAELSENISNRELYLISFVGDQDGAIMSEIADFVGVPMSTATGIVDKLVARGFLRRGHSPHDRRTVRIELDTEGRATYNLLYNMRKEMSGRILSLLDEQEANHFMTLLEKITSGLTQFVDVEEV